MLQTNEGQKAGWCTTLALAHASSTQDTAARRERGILGHGADGDAMDIGRNKSPIHHDDHVLAVYAFPHISDSAREREREYVPSFIVGVARVLDCISEFRLSMIEQAEK